MKQVIRKGLKDIIVDEVPDPVLLPHHVLVRPLYSLISSGTETASIHRESLLSEVADNPSHLRKIFDVAMKTGPVATIAEVRAKFTEYAVLGYSGAGVVAARLMAAKARDTARPFWWGAIWRRVCPKACRASTPVSLRWEASR